MATADSIPIAFWLLPGEADANWLDTRIRSLAAQHGGPTFEPHLTLHVGRCSPTTDIDAVLAGLVQREPISGLTLEAGRTAESAARFKALFIEFPGGRGDAAHLIRLRRNLVDELLKADSISGRRLDTATAQGGLVQALAAYEFLPHLSLLYGELPQVLRRELAARNDVEGRAMRFERVAAVRPATGCSDLSGVERWHVFGHRRLDG